MLLFSLPLGNYGYASYLKTLSGVENMYISWRGFSLFLLLYSFTTAPSWLIPMHVSSSFDSERAFLPHQLTIFLILPAGSKLVSFSDMPFPNEMASPTCSFCSCQDYTHFPLFLLLFSCFVNFQTTGWSSSMPRCTKLGLLSICFLERTICERMFEHVS